MEAIVNWYMDVFGQMIPKEASVFIISLFPILELRGGLLLARLLEVPMWKAILLAMAGNLAPMPVALLLLRKIIAFFKKHGIFKKFTNFLEKKANKNKGKIETAEFWGLTVFVGVPLPMTGAWTGALVASVFEMPYKKSLLCMFVGVCMAAAIMCFVSYGVMGGIINAVT